MVRLAYQSYTESFKGLSKEVWLLAFVMLINRMGAMLLPFMTMYMTSALNFSLAEAGLVMGAYGTGSIVGAYLGGVLTDKYNYYHVQLWSLVGGALFLFCIPLLSSVYSLSACVLVFSLISDMLRPANSVAISTYSTSENRVRSFSLMRLSINLGFAIGPAMGGFIAGTWGYSWIFAFDGITCLLAAALILKYLPYKTDNSKISEDNELAPSLSAYKDTKYLLFIVMVMLYGILFFQLFTTVPVFMKKISGFNEYTIGLLMALNGLLIVIFEMPLIQRLEKISRPFRLVGWGFYFLSVSFLLLILGPGSVALTLSYIVLITMSEMLSMPFMLNFAVSRSSKQRQGQYMALYSMGYGMAHIIAPTASMMIAEIFSFETLYILVIGLSLLIGSIFHLLMQKEYW